MGILYLGVRQLGCEAGHSFAPCAMVKNAWSCTSNTKASLPLPLVLLHDYLLPLYTVKTESGRSVHPNLYSLPYPLIRLFIYEYPLSSLSLPITQKVFF
jgi:hypothetical protein